MTDPVTTALTAQIVSAYVSQHFVPAAEIGALIQNTAAALAGPAAAPQTEAPANWPSKREIEASIKQDGLVSFLDGKTYRTLKRHLTTYNMTPESYRERFGLPATYPMVSPAYSAFRSELAKKTGLGVRPKA